VKRGDDAASTELVDVEDFKNFLRRIVAVPKAAIDRRLAEERRRRAAKRGRTKAPGGRHR
jgi:hypothetical protein